MIGLFTLAQGQLVGSQDRALAPVAGENGKRSGNLNETMILLCGQRSKLEQDGAGRSSAELDQQRAELQILRQEAVQMQQQVEVQSRRQRRVNDAIVICYVVVSLGVIYYSMQTETGLQ